MLHVISFTDNGLKLGKLIWEKTGKECEQTSIHELKDSSLSEWTKKRFKQGETLLFIGACGIAVRTIAPFIKSKATDPAVLVMDELGKHVIPVLSGHLGGANDMAHIISKITGAIPVITTATDINHRFAIDIFAKQNNLKIADIGKIKDVSSYILKGNAADMYIDKDLKTFSELEDIEEINLVADIDSINSKVAVVISYRSDILPENKNKCEILQLYPQSLILGLGCRKGKTADELEHFIAEELLKNKLAIQSVYKVVSIDKKSGEQGILELCDKYKWQFETYSPEILSAQEGSFSHSEFVDKTVGVDNVCERSVSAAGANNIIVKKTCRNGMTLAVGTWRAKE
jgi:cobalt-precorrin 5A hydrolase